ncbi:MAG: Sec-independent protein translocase protein TatB [Pseudomonadota bacterium]
MLDIGMPEFLLIAAIALIVVGPDKLPDIAKTVGRMFGELKKTTNEFKQTIESEINLNDIKNIDKNAIIDKALNINNQEEIDATPNFEDNKNEHGDKTENEDKNSLEKEPEQGTTKDERG